MESECAVRLDEIRIAHRAICIRNAECEIALLELWAGKRRAWVRSKMVPEERRSSLLINIDDCAKKIIQLRLLWKVSLDAARREA